MQKLKRIFLSTLMCASWAARGSQLEETLAIQGVSGQVFEYLVPKEIYSHLLVSKRITNILLSQISHLMPPDRWLREFHPGKSEEELKIWKRQHALFFLSQPRISFGQKSIRRLLFDASSEELETIHAHYRNGNLRKTEFSHLITESLVSLETFEKFCQGEIPGESAELIAGVRAFLVSLRATDLGFGEKKEILSNDGLIINSVTSLGIELLSKTYFEQFTSEEKNAAFRLACQSGNTKFAKFLLNHNVDINSQDDEGWTALFYATDKFQAEMIKWLIENGANMEIKNSTGLTALHFSALNGRTEGLKILIENGMDINSQSDKDIFTALFYAIDRDYIETTRWLIKNGANMEIKSSAGLTALHYAALNGHTEVVDMLIENGMNINSQCDQNRFTALFYAIDGHRTETIKWLIKNGANMEIKSNKGLTVLHYAALNGHTEGLKILIENKADINLKTLEGKTAFHTAALQGNIECLDLLKKYGADMNAQDKNGLTALFYAIDKDHIETARWLIKNGADMGVKISSGFTALDFAALNGHTDGVKILIENGMDINSQSDKNGFTALFYAIDGDHIGTIRWLIKNGANMEIKSANELTALHYAVLHSHADAVRTLLEEGANINEQEDKKLWTPLRICVSRKSWDLTAYLLDKGANPNILDKDGFSALDAADGIPEGLALRFIEKGSQLTTQKPNGVISNILAHMKHNPTWKTAVENAQRVYLESQALHISLDQMTLDSGK